MFNKIRAFAFVVLVIIAVATLVAALAMALTLPRQSIYTTDMVGMFARLLVQAL